MKKALNQYLLLMGLCLMLTVFFTGSLQVKAFQCTGSGTETDPYIAADKIQLDELLVSDGTYYIRLGSNITSKQSFSVCKGYKHLDLNGYSLTISCPSGSTYGLKTFANAYLEIRNSNLFERSTIKVTSSTGPVSAVESGSLVLGSLYCDPIDIITEYPGTTTVPVILGYSNVDCHEGVVIKGKGIALKATGSANDYNIYGGSFKGGINLEAADNARVFSCMLVEPAVEEYIYISRKNVLDSRCLISGGSNYWTMTETSNRVYLKPVGVTVEITQSLGPIRMENPKDQETKADGKSTMTFKATTIGSSGCEWFVSDAENGQNYSWTDVSMHCTYSGSGKTVLNITPNADDYWLNGKYVYCISYNPKGRTESEYARITITLPSIVKVVVEDLNEPQVGQHPDTIAEIRARSKYGVSGSVEWYWFDSNGAGHYMSESEVFEAGKKYAAYMQVEPNGKEIFDSEPDWDDHGYEFYRYSGKLLVNGVSFTNGFVENDGSLLNINYWWGKEAKAPCAHTSTTKKVTKGTFTSDGNVQVVCKDCGDTIKTTEYPQIGTVALSSEEVVYNGKVRTPSVIVKDRFGTAISSSYYTVSTPSGRQNVGTYVYTVTFKSRYSGTRNLTFVINPKAAAISSLTALSKGFTVKWTAVTEQVDGYEIQYSTSGSYSSSKTTDVPGASTTSKKITGRTANKKYYVRIRTYKDVNGERYYSSWSASKTVTTKS